MARDTTRAALIALGLTLAGQACGGDAETNDDDRDQVGVIPPYGLSPFPDVAGGSGGGAGNGGTGGVRDAGGEGGSAVTVPPYGAIPEPTPDGGGSGGSGGAEAPDSGTPDAGGDDAGGDASELPT